MESIPGKPEVSNLYDYFSSVVVGNSHIPVIVSLQSENYPIEGILYFPLLNDAIFLVSLKTSVRFYPEYNSPRMYSIITTVYREEQRTVPYNNYRSGLSHKLSRSQYLGFKSLILNFSPVCRLVSSVFVQLVGATVSFGSVTVSGDSVSFCVQPEANTDPIKMAANRL